MFQMHQEQPRPSSRSHLCTRRRTTMWRALCWRALVRESESVWSSFQCFQVDFLTLMVSLRCSPEESLLLSLLPRLQFCVNRVGAARPHQGQFDESRSRSGAFSFMSDLCAPRFLLFPSQSEDKMKPMRVAPGHLSALEHVVQQDYFPRESIAVLEAFVSR